MSTTTNDNRLGTRKILTLGVICGVVGAIGYFIIEDPWKALGYIVIASLLDIFWDTIITWYEKRKGMID